VTEERYLAHFITIPPDFDQILAVETPLNIRNFQLHQAIQLVLPEHPISNPQAKPQQALKPNDNSTALINGTEVSQKFGVGAEYFFETEDLTT
jgi:hypothetical protein